MLLLPVAFCTPIHKHECDLNIEGGGGANVIVCYNICDGDCFFSSVYWTFYKIIKTSKSNKQLALCQVNIFLPVVNISLFFFVNSWYPPAIQEKIALVSSALQEWPTKYDY